MNATGIVRRVDQLGRIVIPKELRRTLGIAEDDPLEVFTGENGEIILRKYNFQGRAHDAARLIYDIAADMPPAVATKVRNLSRSIMDALEKG